jgi:hypothetical protein
VVVAGAAILPFPKNDNEDDAVANGFVSMRRELLLYRDESAEKPKTQPGRIVAALIICRHLAIVFVLRIVLQRTAQPASIETQMTTL